MLDKYLFRCIILPEHLKALKELSMKFVMSFVLLVSLLVAGASAQTATIQPTNVEFKFYSIGFYTTTFMVGDEKVVHNWEVGTPWGESLTISSPTLKARVYPLPGSGTATKGYPDSYVTDQKTGREWHQTEPVGIKAPMPEKYQEYLKLARKLSSDNWPGKFPQ
jgi:hypothetical protein